jgi:hypothetical protein
MSKMTPTTMTSPLVLTPTRRHRRTAVAARRLTTRTATTYGRTTDRRSWAKSRAPTTRAAVRPASATRKALNAAVERRVVKYMARNPSASRVEASAWATRGRKVRRALNGLLNAG